MTSAHDVLSIRLMAETTQTSDFSPTDDVIGTTFADCYRQTAGPHNTIADTLSPCLCITVAAISFLLEASFTERNPSSIKTARGTYKLQAFPEYHIPTQLDRTAGITGNTALHRVPISGQLTSALAAARQQHRFGATKSHPCATDIGVWRRRVAPNGRPPPAHVSTAPAPAEIDGTLISRRRHHDTYRWPDALSGRGRSDTRWRPLSVVIRNRLRRKRTVRKWRPS